MKKIVSLLLVLAMMMAFAACGNTAPETTAPATGPEEATDAPVETTAPADSPPAPAVVTGIPRSGGRHLHPDGSRQ